MINYRLDNLEEVADQLSQSGAALVKGIEDYPYGRFAWAMDPDGYKTELWEPRDWDGK